MGDSAMGDALELEDDDMTTEVDFSSGESNPYIERAGRRSDIDVPVDVDGATEQKRFPLA